MPVDPDSLTVAPCPMPWPPDIVCPTHVIARAVSIVRPVADLDCNGTRIGGIIPIIGPVSRICTVIGAIIPIIWPVSRISAVILIASGYTERNSENRKE